LEEFKDEDFAIEDKDGNQVVENDDRRESQDDKNVNED